MDYICRTYQYLFTCPGHQFTQKGPIKLLNALGQQVGCEGSRMRQNLLVLGEFGLIIR